MRKKGRRAKGASISTAQLPAHTCPDGYVWVDSIQKCFPYRPLIKDVTLVQGGDCSPPVIRIPKPTADQKRMIREAARRQLQDLKPEALLILEALQRGRK